MILPFALSSVSPDVVVSTIAIKDIPVKLLAKLKLNAMGNTRIILAFLIHSLLFSRIYSIGTKITYLPPHA